MKENTKEKLGVISTVIVFFSIIFLISAYAWSC